jgi:hypothetical protein
MKRELTLSDILRIEDTADVLEICCPDTGIPLWTTIRIALLRLIRGDLLYGVPLVGGSAPKRPGSRLRDIPTILRSFAHNGLRLHTLDQQYPVLLMATDVRLIEREGRYFNCLSDYFVSAAPDRTYAVEDLLGSTWPFPRHYDNVLLHTPLRIEGVMKGRLRVNNYRKPARALVDLVCQRAVDLLGWNVGEARHQWLERLCTNGAASLLPRYQKYQSVFKKMGVRLLIKEEACYGGADNAAAILAAKHLGIVTAEYQHGMVSSGHDAYNFAPAILADHAYGQIFPDYLLTFGSWWGEQINVPIEKLAIGNPHRAETLGASFPGHAQGQQILVLGDGIETVSYLEFCGCLAKALGNNHEVVFRPHPLERDRVWDTHPEGFVGNVRVDAHRDIYSSFREAGAVVSEVSTGLFEAIGLVPKIFIWNTPKARYNYPFHPFHRFLDAAELARLLLDDSAGQVIAQQMESIWAPNWERNYLDFIEQAIRQ